MSEVPSLVAQSPSAKPCNAVSPSMIEVPTLDSQSPSSKPSHVSPSMLPAGPTVPSIEPSVEMQPFSTSMPIRGEVSRSEVPSSSSNYRGKPLSQQPISNFPSLASHSSYNDQQIAWLRSRIGPPPVGIYCDIDSECGLDGICKFSYIDMWACLLFQWLIHINQCSMWSCCRC
jgi:hypothetical protein